MKMRARAIGVALTWVFGWPSMRGNSAAAEELLMGDWVHIQASSGEQLMQLYHFSIIKQQCGGGVPFNITIKEFAVPPPGQRLRFYAEADKAVNQKSASFVPCGWGTSVFAALGDCVRLIRQFPYEGDEGVAS